MHPSGGLVLRRFDHGRVRVAEDERPGAARVIDIFLAVGDPEPRPRAVAEHEADIVGQGIAAKAGAGQAGLRDFELCGAGGRIGAVHCEVPYAMTTIGSPQDAPLPTRKSRQSTMSNRRSRGNGLSDVDPCASVRGSAVGRFAPPTHSLQPRFSRRAPAAVKPRRDAKPFKPPHPVSRIAPTDRSLHRTNEPWMPETRATPRRRRRCLARCHR